MVEPKMRTARSSTGWVPRSDASSLTSVPPAWLKTDTRQGMPSNDPTDSARVLFVCTGNICRSALAAVYLSHLVRGSGITVESAGIGALVGQRMDTRALLLARRLGVDGTPHRARQLTGRMLGGASIVVVFGPEQYGWIQENYPEMMSKTVAIRQLADSAEKSGGSIKSGPLGALVDTVKHTQSVPIQSSWINDPYKKNDFEYMQIMCEVIDVIERLKDQVEW